MSNTVDLLEGLIARRSGAEDRSASLASADLFESMLDQDRDEDDDDILVAIDAMPSLMTERLPFEVGDHAATAMSGLSQRSPASERRVEAAPKAQRAVPTLEVQAWMKPVIETAKVARDAASGAMAATITVDHPILGELQIRVTSRAGAYAVDFGVSSDTARQTLQADLVELHAAFANEGLPLSRVQFQLRVSNRRGGAHGNKRNQQHNHR